MVVYTKCMQYNESREMFNLEVEQICGDPAMRTIFEEMLRDLQALQEYWYLVYCLMIGSEENSENSKPI